jgi:hypothetical protein
MRTIKQVSGLRTWQVESVVVGTVLVVVVAVTHKPWAKVPWLAGTDLEELALPIEWFVAFAVFRTFSNASIQWRLQEAEEKRTAKEVACHVLAARYFIQKEVLWFLSFTLMGAWSALVGVAVFLFYPWWRHAWTRARERGLT